MRGLRACLAAAVLLLAIALPAARTAPPPRRAVPVLAFYYIWFNASSWNRAKVDYPLLGRYSSDEIAVMRRHVAWAKRAGITGFLVSWKGTPVLDRRLARLVRVADAADFKLAVIYQGLDFHRRPLPARRIGQDLDRFLRRFGRDRAFDIFGKPLIVLGGSWEYSARQIAGLTAPRRDRALILAAEKNEEGYRRLAHLVDGDAYYWSSVDPATYNGYRARLGGIGRAIHRTGGLWIAPAAPGFDARLVGGTRVVPRRGGATLRREFNAAMGSSPDAIGLISWNEFSENSQIEPSERDPGRSLAVLAGLLGARAPDIAGDSSDAGAGDGDGVWGGPPLVGGVALLIGGALAVILRRGRRSGGRRRTGEGRAL